MPFATTKDAAPSARQSGFAIVIVLWALVFLSVVVSQILSSGRTETKIANNIRDAAIAENGADGAIYQTLFHLAATDQQHWPARGKYRVMVGDTAVQVSIDNLTGRINPNTATPELLSQVLIALGMPYAEATSLADAIVVARPPATGFTVLDNLGAVRGMTPDLLTRLRPHLTLWWENDPDPTFADRVVLAAMRALGDTRAGTAAVERPTQVVSIVARAFDSRGARFVRQAEAIVNTAAPRLRWRILAWNQQS